MTPETDVTQGQAVVPAQHGERVPPQDLEAERCVLGSMMLSKDAIADVTSSLQVRDYYRPAHATVHMVIVDLYGKGEPADPITVAAELTRRGDIDRVGGPGYVQALVQAVPTPAHAAHYAEIVHERATLRRLTEAGTRITQLGYNGGEADDAVAAAEAEMLDAVKGIAEDDGRYRPLSEDVPDFWDRLDARSKGETVNGVPTGFADLDGMTNGFQPGQLILVGARPATGKSTLAIDFARACSIKHGKTSLFFSLEMDRGEIVDRIYSAEARVALHHVRAGTVTESDIDRLAARNSDIEAAPMIIDDSPNLTWVDIRSRARRIHQTQGLAEVIVDYTQLLTSGASRRPETRQQEVTEISRNLKLLAKELGVPVIALSQLNRGPEQRTDKRPMVSDLRESGSLEQDADLVILLHREDVYEKESPRSGEADLIVGKHRNGPTGTITVAFQGHYSRFVDMAQT